MEKFHFKTIGHSFVEEATRAKNKGELLSSLKDACRYVEGEEKAGKEIAEMDFPGSKEVAKLKATMAKVKIKNSEAKFQKAIAAAKNINQVKTVLKKHLQMERIAAKSQDYAVIAMDMYLERGYGTPEEFKKDVKKLFTENKQQTQVRDKQAGIER